MSEDRPAAGDEQRIDPFLIAVLSSRFEAIMREMTNTIIRTSRSAIIKSARDFRSASLPTTTG